MKEKSKITVKEFRELLAGYDDELELYFGGLDFYRLKDRGAYLQIEFAQSVYPNEEGKVVVENHN